MRRILLILLSLLIVIMPLGIPAFSEERDQAWLYETLRELAAAGLIEKVEDEELTANELSVLIAELSEKVFQLQVEAGVDSDSPVSQDELLLIQRAVRDLSWELAGLTSKLDLYEKQAQELQGRIGRVEFQPSQQRVTISKMYGSDGIQDEDGQEVSMGLVAGHRLDSRINYLHGAGMGSIVLRHERSYLESGSGSLKPLQLTYKFAQGNSVLTFGDFATRFTPFTLQKVTPRRSQAEIFKLDDLHLDPYANINPENQNWLLRGLFFQQSLPAGELALLASVDKSFPGEYLWGAKFNGQVNPDLNLGITAIGRNDDARLGDLVWFSNRVLAFDGSAMLASSWQVTGETAISSFDRDKLDVLPAIAGNAIQVNLKKAFAKGQTQVFLRRVAPTFVSIMAQSSLENTLSGDPLNKLASAAELGEATPNRFGLGAKIKWQVAELPLVLDLEVFKGRELEPTAPVGYELTNELGITQAFAEKKHFFDSQLGLEGDYLGNKVFLAYGYRASQRTDQDRLDDFDLELANKKAILDFGLQRDLTPKFIVLAGVRLVKQEVSDELAVQNSSSQQRIAALGLRYQTSELFSITLARKFIVGEENGLRKSADGITAQLNANF